jgi:uncharacterized protein involved in exopolysaccharide biosynthesis
MEIGKYLDVLWRRKWVLIVTLVVTMVTVGVATSFATPIYASTATIRISPIPGADFEYADYLYGDLLRNTYARVATSTPVLNEVGRMLDLEIPLSPEQVEATVVQDTELLELRVEHEDPTVARDAANALAEVIMDRNPTLATGSDVSAQEILEQELEAVEQEIMDLQQTYDELLAEGSTDLDRVAALARNIRLKENLQVMLLDRYERARISEALGGNLVTLVDPANTPGPPVSPRPLLNLVAAAGVGLIAGLGLVFVFENLEQSWQVREIEA